MLQNKLLSILKIKGVFYSGKKKFKTEVRINNKGSIIQISKSYPSSAHDLKLFKHQTLPLQESKVLVYSGYQGIIIIIKISISSQKYQVLKNHFSRERT
ncbi:MAG: hypothetical protein P857_1025 [Candidatus Xenolissoclinum pacificiensis L6]|uniref:Uncharacterized protein n=1 Tax=Candidatus Xenolissoclinum pacificiensis L6 TaxID=1401685 RepID=W2V2G5_9RICK|nr:MAG: hypothetical protein P857_1025 [Candidatus Xenolissoclinum pacificiensis L6]